jgi:hypothetical protein
MVRRRWQLPTAAAKDIQTVKSSSPVARDVHMHSASASDDHISTAALAATLAITLVIIFIAASAAFGVEFARSHRSSLPFGEAAADGG